MLTFETRQTLRRLVSGANKRRLWESADASCANCGTPFEYAKPNVRGTQKYCSSACKKSAWRRDRRAA